MVVKICTLLPSYDFVVSAVLLNIDLSMSSSSAGEGAVAASSYTGLLSVCAASAISGLSAALSQRAMARTSRSPMIFSAELAVYGIAFLLVNQLFNSDIVDGNHMFSHWSIFTLLPVLSNVSMSMCCHVGY